MGKLEQFIDNIEQLSADARYENNYEQYDKLMITLNSIEWWTKKTKKLVEEKQEKEVEK